MARLASLTVALALIAATALAQSPQAGMGHMPGGMPGMAGGNPMSANDAAMIKSMDAMNRDMASAPMTGDPDQDFVAMMTPHHRGAIDMARIYLHDGKDPEIRKMAEAIVSGQETEIAEFKAWQVKHPSPAR